MNTGKIVGGILIALGISSTIYFGLIHKFEYGLNGFKKLSGIISREDAIRILDEISGVKSDPEKVKGFSDTYIISRANAAMAKKDSFMVDEKKYSTKTGKSV